MADSSGGSDGGGGDTPSAATDVAIQSKAEVQGPDSATAKAANSDDTDTAAATNTSQLVPVPAPCLPKMVEEVCVAI